VRHRPAVSIVCRYGSQVAYWPGRGHPNEQSGAPASHARAQDHRSGSWRPADH